MSKNFYSAIKLVASCALLSVAYVCVAADEPTPALPVNDIVVFEIMTGPDGERALSDNWMHLTYRDGYDNQPEFSADGQTLYFTRGFDTQTEIMAYDFRSRQLERLTSTQAGEYSPTPIPGRDAISVIRQFPDGKQYLWSIPADGSSGKSLFPGIEPVGYHAWHNPQTATMFVLGDPSHFLHQATLGSESRVKSSNIGRSLHTKPGTDQVSYVQKGESSWQIRLLNADGSDGGVVVETLPQVEDYAWFKNGQIVMGKDSKLMIWGPDSTSQWRLLADLAELGFKDISRLAVSSDGKRIAVVHSR